jgi:hypothetical protein
MHTSLDLTEYKKKVKKADQDFLQVNINHVVQLFSYY